MERSYEYEPPQDDGETSAEYAVTYSDSELTTVVDPEFVRRGIGRRNTRAVRLCLMAADIAAIVASFLTASLLRGAQIDLVMLAILAAALPFWLAGIKSSGMYDRENTAIGHSTIDEIPALTRVATIGCWLFVILAWAVGKPQPLAQAVVFWLALIVAFPLFRSLIRPTIRSSSNYPQNTIIVGAGSVGQLIARKLLVHPEYRINLLGFLDAMPKERRDDLRTLTILGTPEDLERVVDEYEVERVIIAFSNDSHEDTMNFVRLLTDHDVQINIVPRLFDVIPPAVASETIEGIPLITLPPLRLSTWARALKRTLDLTVSIGVLTLIAPVLIVTAALIRLDSPGPILFRQRRVGVGGEQFEIYKFRTMVVDADHYKSAIAHLNAHAKPGGDPRMFKVQEDPRVTLIGRLLRRFSLDEFPQLLNVLNGEMSLIGPRPLIPEEDRYVEDWGRKRLALKPGMTGLWQVSGRNRIPFEDMVKLDYMYVYSWSLSGDLRLLLRTIPLVLGGERSGDW